MSLTDLPFTPEAVGERIKQRRLELDIKPKHLAAACGVSHVSISKWEHGNVKNVRGSNLIALAKKLDTTPQWILYGENRDTRLAEVTRLQDSIIDTLLAEQFSAAELNDISRYLALVLERRRT